MEQQLIYELPLNVRYGEVGHDGRTLLSALGNWLQEAAGQSADRLGFGEQALADMGVTWILTRLVLRIRALPPAGTAVRVRTWPSRLDHLAYRGYEVYDTAGALLVAGGSAWAVMDLGTRRLCPFPPGLLAAYPPSTPGCEAFTGRTLPRLRTAVCAAPIVARRDDLDINGHVNNARYLPWLLECLPWTPGHSLLPELVDITFQAECFPGETLMSLCGVPADTTAVPHILVHALRRAHSAEEDVCRAVTRWETLPALTP